MWVGFILKCFTDSVDSSFRERVDYKTCCKSCIDLISNIHALNNSHTRKSFLHMNSQLNTNDDGLGSFIFIVNFSTGILRTPCYSKFNFYPLKTLLIQHWQPMTAKRNYVIESIWGQFPEKPFYQDLSKLDIFHFIHESWQILYVIVMQVKNGSINDSKPKFCILQIQ